MQISFTCESIHVQMSSNIGLTLGLGLKLKSDSAAFGMQSGVLLSEAVLNLTVHPESMTPYAEKFEADGRLGEFRPFMALPTKQYNVYLMWLHIPDAQFNTLMYECSRQNWPIDVTVGVDEGLRDDDPPDGLNEGVFLECMSGNSTLALRYFLFTVTLPAPACLAPAKI
jgi:hypothetical protein